LLIKIIIEHINDKTFSFIYFEPVLSSHCFDRYSCSDTWTWKTY